MDLSKNIYNAQFRARRWAIGKYYGLRRTSEKDVEANFAPRKILFVLTGLLGDSVMSIPAIIAAKHLWKDAHITLLCKKHNRELLAACPFIDDFYVFAPDPMSLRNKREIGELQKWLNESNFDLSVILLGDQFAHLLAKAKIPVRVGVRGDVLEPCLTHAYDIGSPQTWGSAERLNALRCLDYEIEHVKPQLWVEKSARVSTRDKLANLGLKNSRSYVVVHPFGSEPRKWWNLDKIPAAAEILKQKFDLDTVLIGGKETIPAIPAHLNESVINTAGQFNIQELTAVLDDAKVVVTTDSGPFHIAGALNKPIIGLFRERSPQLAGQNLSADVIFGDDAECRKQCGWNFCRTIPCCQLSNISVADVARAFEKVLSAANK
jgi:ADP-heptose:LPS heptosyltransferase